jgi:tetratricopeptide (TPR) repeat protein
MVRRKQLALVVLTAALAFVLGAAGAGVLTHTALLPSGMRSALAASRLPEAVLLPAPATPVRDPGQQEDAVVVRRAMPEASSTPAVAPAPPEAAPVAVEPAPPEPIATLAAPPLPVAEAATDLLLPPAENFAAQSRQVALEGLRHEWQTWNNCGPATLATLLSYYGSPLTQADIGAALRQSPDDKNVSPDELLAYAQERGMAARLRVDGSAALMRTLLASGYPVLIETWLEEQPNDGMGHYRLLTGYNDDRQGWIAYDSYVSTGLLGGGGAKGGGEAPYAGILLPYAETDALWKVFNRTYLLVYPPEEERQVAALLAAHGATDDERIRPPGNEGADLWGAAMWAAAERTARDEIAANGADPFAWFNLGTALWNLNRTDEAVAAFDQARTIGLPWRMLWYQFAPFAAYHAAGRYQDVLDLANATLANVESVEEVFYWKGRALQALGEADAARAALERALALAPAFVEARTALGQ